MPAVFEPNEVVVTIDGTDYPAILVSFQTSVGASAGVAEAVLVNEFARSSDPNDFLGREASVTVDGATLITGHALRVRPQLSDESVVVRILDKRWMLNKTWIGQRHFGEDGIPILGADIIFNKDGKPNKDTTALEFVYENASTTDETCAIVEGDLWTYGQILEWIWTHYVDDITIPTIPLSGGMEWSAEEISLLGTPVGDAIDEIFARTSCALAIDADGQAYIFNRLDPRAVMAVSTVPAFTEVDNTAYTLDFPSEIVVTNSAEKVITDVDIVGGFDVKEINLTQADWLAPVLEKELQPSPMKRPDVVPETGATLIESIFWSNFQTEATYRFVFDKSRYELHGLGKNTRRKDAAKLFLSELMTKRNRQGEFVPLGNECGISGIKVGESLGGQYVNGFSVDLDRASVIVPRIFYQPLPTAPLNFAVSVQTEQRSILTVSQPVPALPIEIHRAIIRQEFAQQTRESLRVEMPVDVSWVILLLASGGINTTWTAVPSVPIPAGATLVPPDVHPSGLYWTFNIAGLAVPRTSFQVQLPAGTEFDAQSALTQIAGTVQDEIGKMAVNVEASYPSFKPVDVGTLLQFDGATYGAGVDQIVVAVNFDGDNQSSGFASTNHIGADALTLARRFLDVRRFYTRRI